MRFALYCLLKKNNWEEKRQKDKQIASTSIVRRPPSSSYPPQPYGLTEKAGKADTLELIDNWASLRFLIVTTEILSVSDSVGMDRAEKNACLKKVLDSHLQLSCSAT